MPHSAYQQIRELYNAYVTDVDLLFDFNLFHSSVNQKLWSVNYYLTLIEGIDINEFLIFPLSTSTATQSAGLRIPQEPYLDIHSFCQYMNLYLDGFFMNARSVLDTLGHTLYTIYVATNTPPRIYVQTANTMLSNEHNTSEVSTFLNSQLTQARFSDFEPFRHCTTHESLIRYDDIGFRYDQIESKYKLTKDIILPDDPQTRPFTFTRHRTAKRYCKNVKTRIHTLVNGVYGKVLRDAHTNGDVFPIP